MSDLQIVHAALALQISTIELEHRLRLCGVLTPYRACLHDAFECILNFLSQNGLHLITDLDLLNNDISRLPDNFSSLGANLVSLNLLRNSILLLPDNAFTATLRSLDLSDNKLRSIPKSLLASPQLQILRIQNNSIEKILRWMLDLQFLRVFDVAGNPLILPSIDAMIQIQKQVQNGESWKSALKIFFITAYTKEQQQQQSTPTPSARDKVAVPVRDKTPTSTRENRSGSATKDTYSLDSLGSDFLPKASRRRGLVMKMHDDTASGSNPTTPTKDPPRSNKSMTNLELQRVFPTGESDSFTSPNGSGGNTSSLLLPSIYANYNYGSSERSTSSTNVASPTSSSAPFLPITPQQQQLLQTISSHSSSKASYKSRNRSNTMREIDKILEKNDSVDTENKSSAYFRRLLTLQENSEEIIGQSYHGTSHSKLSSEVANQRAQALNVSKVREEPVQRTLSAPINGHSSARNANMIPEAGSTTLTPASIPSSSKAKRIPPHMFLKASRKVLFAFSEVHGSVRRFTAFCIDKKVAEKMVPYLYANKANIDNLVETLEANEDGPSNVDSITQCLRACTSSFRLIMNLLRDNITVFAATTEVCFIRMIYLTIFGALNELRNAYNVIESSSLQSGQLLGEMKPQEGKQKLTINTKVGSEGGDEYLRRSVQSVTTASQLVLEYLTKAISKGALAQANTVGAQPSAAVTSRVRDLTNKCISSMDITKRLRAKLETASASSLTQDYQALWDETNWFVEAMVQLFLSVKAAMEDWLVLDEIRPKLSSLLKATKDVARARNLLSYRISTALPPSVLALANMPSIFTPMSGNPLPSSVNSAPQQILGSRNGPVPATTTTITNPAISATTMDPSAAGNNSSAPLTAPAHSTGQYFAKNGMNPFDGFIIAKESSENKNSTWSTPS